LKAGHDLAPRIVDEHKLLLRAVLLRGDAAIEAFAQWRSFVNVETVDEPSQRLLPLLARRLPDIAPDDPVRRLVQGIYRYAWARNHRLWRAALPVLGALRARRIPTLLLKGAAILHAYSNDWGARPMYDVDVLVPAACAMDAVDALATNGWEPEQDQSAAWVRWRALPNHHSWGFTMGDGRVDLHWHVLPDSIGAHADEMFWANARTILVDGRDERILDPGDLLVHVLVHGTTATNRPPLQWIADSVMLMRAASDAEMYHRFATRVRSQSEVATVARGLETIGDVLGAGLVAQPLMALRKVRPGIVEFMRRAGGRREPVRQLARHSAGGEGLIGGAAGLVSERLDLALTTHRAAALTYGASLRSSHVARAWRSRVGSFVRTAVADPPAVGDGETLDFTWAPTLDRHGSVGWGRTESSGATTKGSEPRLVLPLASSLRGVDIVVTLELEARDRESVIAVRANETLVGVNTVPVDGTELRLAIPAATAGCFSPLELAFRNAARHFARPSSVRLRLRRVMIDRQDALACRPKGALVS
jgi:hypothetical protein